MQQKRSGYTGAFCYGKTLFVCHNNKPIFYLSPKKKQPTSTALELLVLVGIPKTITSSQSPD